MCGIAGSFNLASLTGADVGRALKAMAHRGPDGQTVREWKDPACALGHRLLAIQGNPQDCVQPMSYGGDRYWLTFNGEVYNFIELRQELESKGYSFKTGTDSEVVLASFIEWDTEAFKKWNGMWALAIYDREKKRLVISRDRFGVKPLYLFIQDHGVAFSSELKGFWTLRTQLNLSWDEKAVRTALISSAELEATYKTLLKGVTQLPPGHYMEFFPDRHREVQWWNTLDELQTIPKTEEDQVSRFFEILLDATRLRLRSTAPVTTSLSGGLDSSSIVALLNHSGSWKQKTTFTHRFPGSELDETHFAQEVIDHCGIEPQWVDTSKNEIIDHIDHWISNFESIYPGMPDSPYRIYAKQALQGYRVSIDGHGGDELLGGYHGYVYQAMRQNLLRPWKIAEWRNFQKDQAGPFFSDKAWMMGVLRAGRSASELNLAPRAMRAALDPLSRCVRGLLENDGVYVADIPRLAGFDTINAKLYDDFHLRILPRILKNFDLASMANGIEVRMPFLDYRLVSYCFSLPSSTKISPRGSKWILRSAVSQLLPESIVQRKLKLGFNSPMQDWLSGLLKEWVQESLEEPSPFDSVIRRDALQAYFTKKVSTRQSSWSQAARFWGFVSARRLSQIWQKEISPSFSS